ncbi:galactosyl transferase GMA12/MNN10 family-domain-containing protein [Apiospora arundinis]|uniref:Galactosyl transferase GMA12/MNN10 family-domain-containing protein n=1 Tax=Apiospora arundinis TaxID=335852 RepID=A0ABR2IFW8_9PEZI
MHFAYPPRKSSNPPPFLPRSSRITALRRNRLKLAALACLSIIFLFWLFSGSKTKSSPKRVITGTPPVVIVTAFDEKSVGSEFIRNAKANRREYAKLNGYKVHLVSASDYDLNGSPLSWAKVPAMRHAMAKYPNAKFFWYLDQNSLIMNPSLKIDDYVLSARKLETNMIKDLPVVPPDSIIKTFSHLKGDDVSFVLTQDKEGLSSGSFIIRNGDWAEFFLDTWFDPLYRSYNFQKAEAHALEHIVQWHPTILSKLAIVPQRLINAYSNNKVGAQYEDNDIVVRFPGCANPGELQCEEESKRFLPKWQQAFKNA